MYTIRPMRTKSALVRNTRLSARGAAPGVIATLSPSMSLPPSLRSAAGRLSEPGTVAVRGLELHVDELLEAPLAQGEEEGDGPVIHAPPDDRRLPREPRPHRALLVPDFHQQQDGDHGEEQAQLAAPVVHRQQHGQPLEGPADAGQDGPRLLHGTGPEEDPRQRD